MARAGPRVGGRVEVQGDGPQGTFNVVLYIYIAPLTVLPQSEVPIVKDPEKIRLSLSGRNAGRPLLEATSESWQEVVAPIQMGCGVEESHPVHSLTKKSIVKPTRLL